MKTSQARDGRMSIAMLFEPDMTESGLISTTSLAVGDMGFVAEKASSESGFGDVPKNAFFIADKSMTLKTGDKLRKGKLLFLGHATSKSLSQSKNVVDVTMDYDEATNNVTDGVVSSSGSISGSAVTETLKMASGINTLQNRFTSITSIVDGVVTYKEANTTEKDILIIFWNLRDAKPGDILDIDVVPALFSNLSKDASYGSSQTFNVDYTGNFSDENCFIGGHYQVKNVEGLIPKLVRPEEAAS